MHQVQGDCKNYRYKIEVDALVFPPAECRLDHGGASIPLTENSDSLGFPNLYGVLCGSDIDFALVSKQRQPCVRRKSGSDPLQRVVLVSESLKLEKFIPPSGVVIPSPGEDCKC